MIISSYKRASIEESFVVVTPLDAIMRLEGSGRIATVVLAGSFATTEIATSLGELYPTIRIECER